MVLYLSEKKAEKLFKKYKKVVAMSVDRSMKAMTIDENTSIGYVYPKDLYPTTDELNGYLRGDLSYKKVWKATLKRISSLKCKDPYAVDQQVLLCTTLSMLADEDPPVLVFLRPDTKNGDPEAKKMDKFFKKYLKELFSCFGVEVETKISKKLLKGNAKKVKRAIKKHMIAHRDLSSFGRYRLNVLKTLHYAEVQKATIDGFDLTDVPKKTYEKMAERFISGMTGEYIRNFNSKVDWKKQEKAVKGAKKKVLTAIYKQAKKNNKFYEEYRQMINGMNYAGIKTLPKAPKFGKKIKAKTMKKFTKFFKKRKNIGFLVGAYTHIVTQTYNIQIGCGDYNKAMNEAHVLVNVDGFAKAFAKLATEVKKATAQSVSAAA